MQINEDLRHKPVEKGCVSREADCETPCNDNNKNTLLIDALCFGRYNITDNDIGADEEISLEKFDQMNEETTRHATHKSSERVSTELIDVLAYEKCITNNEIINSELLGPEKTVQPGVFTFHEYTSAPTSVAPCEEIKAPMSAPLPVIQDSSPVSLSKFYDSGNTIINTSSPVSVISGVGVLPMSEEEPFVDSESSWIPESEEETRRKRNWNSIKNNYDKQKSKKSKAKKKKKVDRQTSSSSTSESENEPSVIITTNALIHNPRRDNSHIRKDSSSDTENEIPNYRSVTIDETTDCESVIGNIQEQSVEANVQEKNNFRWKKKDESKWKRAVEKEKKLSCLPYKDAKGKLHAAKLPKLQRCNRICRHKCSEAFSETERLKICKDYWCIKDFKLQKEYLLKRIIIKPVARSLNILSVENRKSTSREYSFFKNGEFVRVCKSFFTSTLAISNGPIETAVKNINEVGSFGGNDKRGKKIPPNKTSEESIKDIKDHIESFPKIESHYCRKDTTRQYLSEKLSICKMYELYSQKMQNENKIPVKFNIYQKIFGTEYNFSFFHPKKDQCCICNRYKRTPDPDESLKKEYEDHIKRKEASFVSKEKDKKKSEDDPTYLCVTMDLQSLLQIPCTADSLMYYCRKLNLYNLSIYEFKPPVNNAHCMIWSEINGKRGSTEIASAINLWLKSVPEDVTSITIYSDTCSGQNRNQFMAAFLMHVVQTNPKIKVIEQKYLESGHTFMEVDSMHSAIEREKRFTDVFSIIDWKGIMHRARSTRHNKNTRPYNVTELSFNDMIDVKTLASKVMFNRSVCTDGSKVNWLKIKCLRFEKECPGIVQIRYDYEGSYLTLDTQSTKRGRLTRSRPSAADITESLFQIRLEKAYTQQLPLTKDKKKDLLNLCRKKIIPEELHAWYESLPSTDAVIANDSESE